MVARVKHSFTSDLWLSNIANRIAQRKRGRQLIHCDRDRSLLTPVSFSMLDYNK